MTSMFIEASDNIRVMHEIETILDNDDIPVRSRSYFLKFISISVSKKLTPKQQKNVKIFRELFIRIDKDTRLFRTFLNLAIDLAVHFKFENSPLVYAFRNLSIEEHFLNFVDFAKRQNPVIDKNSPLQLFLSLGISIVKLALQKNQLSKRRKDIESNKRALLSQYNDLSKEMSERFINMDFGQDMTDQHEDYSADLNDFNNDFDDDDDVDDVVDDDKKDVEQPITIAEVHAEQPSDFLNNINTIDCQVLKDEISIEEKDVVSVDDIDDIFEKITDEDDAEDDDDDSGFVKGIDTDILKPLKNGDKELNLQNLDSLVMEAGRQFGPAVFNTISSSASDKPVVRFNNNHNVQNIVDFINYK